MIEEKWRTHKPKIFNITSTTPTKTYAEDKRPRCPGCNSTHQHQLKDFRKFKDLPVEKRAKIVEDSNLCLRCLVSGHLGKGCTKIERCSKPECDGTPHLLLNGAPRLFPKRTESKTSMPTTFSRSVASRLVGRRILLPILSIILKANGKEFPCCLIPEVKYLWSRGRRQTFSSYVVG